MENNQYVYILKTREFLRTGENIFKIGRTEQKNVKRFEQYPKGSTLYFQSVCDNCRECERKIINQFKNKFIQRKEFGNEYFEGDLKEMIIMICDIVLCKNENNVENELAKLRKMYEYDINAKKLEITNYKNKFKNCMNDLLKICNKCNIEIDCMKKESNKLMKKCKDFENKCIELKKKSRFQIFMINDLIKYANIINDKIGYNCNLELNYNYLSRCENISWSIIKANPNKPWNFTYLSKNPSITWNIIKSNYDKPWDFEYVSKNPNITWEIVSENPNKPWNYRYLSENHNITWDIVKNNLDKNWCYLGLSVNPNITLEIAKLNCDKPWDYKLLRFPRYIVREITKNCYNLVSYNEIQYVYLSELKDKFNLKLKTKYYLKLTKMRSNDLAKYFRSNKEQFIEYHNLYDNSEKNAYKKIITELDKINTRRKKVVIDMGCGLAKIAEHFKNDKRFEFINYDHVSTSENIIECDISQMPLEEYSVEICIMSMSLWGSNCEEYIREAYRVLETGGKLYIIDSTKRWSDITEYGVIVKETEGKKLKNILLKNKFQVINECVDKWCMFEIVK